MSNKNYVLGTREPSGGDSVWREWRTKDNEYPLPVVRTNSVGKLEDKHARMKGMYNEKKGNVIVPTHPKEDVDMSRIN